MNLNINGYAYFRGDWDLIELIIIDEKSRSNYFHPTETDIRAACAEHDLPYETLSQLIHERSRDVHTIFINVPVFLAGLAKEEEPLDEGDDALLKTKIYKLDSEQALIEFESMQGPFSIRVPLVYLQKVKR